MAKQSNTREDVPADGKTAVICFAPHGRFSDDVEWILSEGQQRGWYPIWVDSDPNVADAPTVEPFDPDGHHWVTRGANALMARNLLDTLESRGVEKLVLCGGHTNHEIASTTRSGIQYGFDVVVVADTTSPGETRSLDGICPPRQDVQAISLAILEQIGAVVTTVDGILSESYESPVADAIAELYTDAVGESDLVNSEPLPGCSIHSRAALVVVNVCDDYLAPEFGYRNNNEAEELIEGLVTQWRSVGREVVHTRHPPGLSHEHAVRQGTMVTSQPGELVVETRNGDAFDRTALDGDLEARGIDQLVFVGLPIQGAVSDTVRTALEYGYEVVIVDDATAGYDFVSDAGFTVAGTEAHWVEVTSLAALGCSITDTESLLRSL